MTKSTNPKDWFTKIFFYKNIQYPYKTLQENLPLRLQGINSFKTSMTKLLRSS